MMLIFGFSISRAENSNTHRHIPVSINKLPLGSRFSTPPHVIGVESLILRWPSNDRIHLEARSIIDGLLKHLFRSILANHWAELDHAKCQFPNALTWFSPKRRVVLTSTTRLVYCMEDAEDLDEYEDFRRHAEVQFSQLVKEMHNTDYILGTSPSAHLTLNPS
jgi:hypothetical protein